MGHPSDTEPTARFSDADLDAVWARIHAGVVVDDEEDEGEGATEIVQMLDLADLTPVEAEGDTGAFRLDGPGVRTDPSALERHIMPHTPVPAFGRGQAVSRSRWAIAATGAIALAAAFGWFFLG